MAPSKSMDYLNSVVLGNDNDLYICLEIWLRVRLNHEKYCLYGKNVVDNVDLRRIAVKDSILGQYRPGGDSRGPCSSQHLRLAV